MSCNWFPTKVYCFHECLLTKFWLLALNIRVCTDTEHQGNRYPAARNSAPHPETFTQQLNTPGTVTILQGAPVIFQAILQITNSLQNMCMFIMRYAYTSYKVQDSHKKCLHYII